MRRPRLGPAALALLALLSACGRKKGAPAAVEAQASVEAPAPAVEWSFYELGGLVVIEGEVDKPTRLTLTGTTLREEREAEVGPVRWELYKPSQSQNVELQDHEGRILGTWTFRGVRAKAQELPPPIAQPANGGPTESEVAALASRITWTTAEPEVRIVAQARPVEPPPQVRPVPNPKVELPGSRAGLVTPEDPRNPKPLPDPLPRVNPVVPPRVSVSRPQLPPTWADPRRPGTLPEATPSVSPVIPPRVATARTQAFATPQEPRQPGVLPDPTPQIRPVVPPRVGTSQSHAFARPETPGLPGTLPEATPRVNPVYPPRVGTPKAHAIGTTTDPRRPGILPEATPEVRPVLPPRASVPSGRTPISAAVEPKAPARLPAHREILPGTWPGAGEALNLIRGPRNTKHLVLTFDGGSNAEAADEILDTLRAKRIRTTFFLTGVFIQSFPDLTRRIAREGHEIGNHTQNHPHFAPNMRRDPHWSRERFQEELLAADSALFHLLGRPMDPIWRAPYGEHTAEIRGWAEELGYRHVGWTEGADTLDWATPKERKLYRTGNAVMERLHARLKRDGDGLIALMHLGSERDEEDRPSKTLSRFVDRAVKEGWQFVTVGDYLRTLGKPAWDPTRRMAWLNSPRVGGTN